MSAHTTDSPAVVHTTTGPMTWHQAAEMTHDDAASRAVAEFLRHRATSRLALLAWLAVGIVVVACSIRGEFLAALLVAATAYAYAGWTESRARRWALDQVETTDPPTGRLRVLAVMLHVTRAGACNRDVFVRLLTNAPDDLTCGALGRHLSGYCPHSSYTW